MNEPAVTEVAPEPELPEDVASAWATVVIDIFEKQKRDELEGDAPVATGGFNQASLAGPMDEGGDGE
jgi:hypothetical protein